MQQAILTFAKKLISIPSNSGNKKESDLILKIVKEMLSEYTIEEFEKDNFSSLLIHNRSHGTKQFKIILNAHLDVVPAKKEQYKPVERDGKLYGRGAYDMKTAAAVMIFIFKKFAKDLPYPIALQIVTDEEIGGLSGTNAQVEKGIRADFVIAGENTDLKINNKAKGIIRFKITAFGKSAHGAYPWLGENAIWKMQSILQILKKLYPLPDKSVWATTVNLANIESTNTEYNKVPDKCTVYLDIRYIPEDREKIIKKIKDILPEDIFAEVVLNSPAQFTEKDNEYIKKLVLSIEKITHKKPQIIALHGASDIRFYESVGGKGICFGPVGSGHHSDNEWVDIESLNNYAKVLEHFLLSICKQTRRTIREKIREESLQI